MKRLREKALQAQRSRLAAALAAARQGGMFSRDPVPGLDAAHQAKYDAAAAAHQAAENRAYWKRERARETREANQVEKFRLALQGKLGGAARDAALLLLKPPRGIHMTEAEMRTAHGLDWKRHAMPRRPGLPGALAAEFPDQFAARQRGQGPAPAPTFSEDPSQVGLVIPQTNVLSDFLRSFSN
jgi:hypothetical protein